MRGITSFFLTFLKMVFYTGAEMWASDVSGIVLLTGVKRGKTGRDIVSAADVTGFGIYEEVLNNSIFDNFVP